MMKECKDPVLIPLPSPVNKYAKEAHKLARQFLIMYLSTQLLGMLTGGILGYFFGQTETSSKIDFTVAVGMASIPKHPLPSNNLVDNVGNNFMSFSKMVLNLAGNPFLILGLALTNILFSSVALVGNLKKRAYLYIPLLVNCGLYIVCSSLLTIALFCVSISSLIWSKNLVDDHQKRMFAAYLLIASFITAAGVLVHVILFWTVDISRRCFMADKKQDDEECLIVEIESIKF